MHGGNLVAKVIKAQGVETVFTLCGGHISPILVGCKQLDITVVDVRQEATAVFAADAMARLTGIPGVAIVTAGPGATNTVTAMKNAQLAQSPIIVIGGAPATMLKGRGALQDINLVALFKSVVKKTISVKRVKDLVPELQHAFQVAQENVPGPVFVECPVDVLYEEKRVRETYGLHKTGRSWTARVTQAYMGWHVNRLFMGVSWAQDSIRVSVSTPTSTIGPIRKLEKILQQSEKPLLLIGSQTLVRVTDGQALEKYVTALGIPVYLAGMARGLLGNASPLQLRHQRRQALKEADVVVLVGVPCDFRLDYGRQINRNTVLVSINRSRREAHLNRRPKLAILGDSCTVLKKLTVNLRKQNHWQPWLQILKRRDEERDNEIRNQATQADQAINPLELFLRLNELLTPRSTLIADGGDFVATGSYVLQPPRPLSWLDPGVFGTLGVGAGFALSAKLVNPESDIWVLFGDGALGYSIAEIDTFVRHGIPIVALVGNNAGWAQVAREQVEIFNDDVATVLGSSDYHAVAEGFGAVGLLLDDTDKITETLQKAKQLANAGHVVLVNVKLAHSDFRRGSISM